MKGRVVVLAMVLVFSKCLWATNGHEENLRGDNGEGRWRWRWWCWGGGHMIQRLEQVSEGALQHKIKQHNSKKKNYNLIIL